MQIDYQKFANKSWEAMPAEEFVGMVSSPQFLGNFLLKTQHFIGVSRWERTCDEEITGYHQLRVAHQKYTDESRDSVSMKGHAHGGSTMWYRKVDGVWKFGGLRPDVRWFEDDYDKLFGKPGDSPDESKAA